MMMSLVGSKVLLFAAVFFLCVCRGAALKKAKKVLVVGSANADYFIEVENFPGPGETVVACSASPRCLSGGKGANQAIAASRLGATTEFLGQFGDDAEAAVVESSLKDSGVALHNGSTRHRESSTGRGFVFVRRSDGVVASAVTAGANNEWGGDLEQLDGDVIMLQCEVPEAVNLAVARAVKGAVIFLDAGGCGTTKICPELLALVDYVVPNRHELARLLGEKTVDDDDGLVDAARRLQALGARNVLVTIGAEGAILVDSKGAVHRQHALIPTSPVLDETGAGDCFRAAFAVASSEGMAIAACLELASAAGALACTKVGGAIAAPTRAECEELIKKQKLLTRGGASDYCPWEFASRLNSMKDRRDLTDRPNDTLGWIARQGEIDGLDYVDFNFPQHLEKCTVAEVKAALTKAGLKCGAICLRYPAEKFRRGAMTHPDAALRQQAVEMTIEAAKWAEQLGCGEVCVWSAWCGYDYSLQVDYTKMWDRVVDAFRKVCDAAPLIKISLEFKPTDENTRFFAVPSTGAAIVLVEEIGRENMGLTLDIGHCLAAGENPAQSAAMVGARGKLFGVQMNDGYQRIGAEDGLMVGSVHPLMALDFVLWLIKTDFQGHVYFDTFPRNEDPVREAEFNIRAVKKMYSRALRLLKNGLDSLNDRHDSLGVLELLEKSEQ